MSLAYLLQPYYGTAPDAGNALIEWGKSPGVAGKNYIDNTGHPVILNGAGGTWQASENPEWPFRWLPDDPADPKNTIYLAGTMLSKGGGNDHWVPNAELVSAIAFQREHPLAIPGAVSSPTPVPPIPIAPASAPVPSPPPGALAWLESLLAHWRKL